MSVSDMNLYEGHADQVFHMPVLFLHIMSNEVTQLSTKLHPSRSTTHHYNMEEPCFFSC